MSKVYLGIDLGTSSVRAFLTDFSGQICRAEGESYEVILPRAGWAEQDPREWFDRTAAAIRRALAVTGVDPRRIAAVSFSGQMHGLVALGEDGEPVTNAVIWMDQRGGEVLDEIEARAGELIRQSTLNRMSSGFLTASMYWLRTRQPELYARIRRVMLPKDYIRYRLTGRVCTDYSDAAGSLAFDNRRLCWAEPLLARLGLDAGLFPQCLPSTQVVGEISAEAAALTGLAEGTPVVNGGGDTFMQAVGSGVIEEGVVSSNIGTAGQMSATSREPLCDPQLRANTFAHVVPDRWHVMAGCLNSGISLKWAARTLGQGDYAALDREVAQRPAGSGGLFFLPYLTGERAPHMDPKARGVFFGLTLEHGRADLERAVMEGVVYALNDCLNVLLEMGVPCRRVMASGGGARSDVWLQMQADIFQRDVYRNASKEQASLGAAITAAVGTGAFASFEEACARCVEPPRDVFHPDEARAAVYRRGYEIFREIYKQNKALFARIGDSF